VDGRRGWLYRDASAIEQADADEIANGTLYGVALVDLSGKLGDG
jgi:hypothetical protein